MESVEINEKRVPLKLIQKSKQLTNYDHIRNSQIEKIWCFIFEKKQVKQYSMLNSL